MEATEQTAIERAALEQQLRIAERIKVLQLERGELLVQLWPHLQKLNCLDGAISELQKFLGE